MMPSMYDAVYALDRGETAEQLSVSIRGRAICSLGCGGAHAGVPAIPVRSSTGRAHVRRSNLASLGHSGLVDWGSFRMDGDDL
jgi:hypothetical protein